MILTFTLIIMFGRYLAKRREMSTHCWRGLSVIMTPLRKDAPLWSIVLITDLADGGAARWSSCTMSLQMVWAA